MKGNSKTLRIVIGIVIMLAGFYLQWASSRPKEAPAPSEPSVKQTEGSSESAPVSSEPDTDTLPVFGKANKEEDTSPPPVESRPAKPERPAPKKEVRAEKESSTSSGAITVSNVKVRDLDGNVVLEGTVDLTESVERIQAGQKLDRFRHDGITFENRERKLPAKPKGYYHEHVHPTPGVSGPGPQRIIAGESGEMWYTHDHYRTFRKIVP